MFLPVPYAWHGPDLQKGKTLHHLSEAHNQTSLTSYVSNSLFPHT